MSTRDDLVAYAERAAHDLKNPVTGMSMSLEMALEEVEPGSEAADLIERAQRSLAKLEGIIQGLPELARDWPAQG